LEYPCTQLQITDGTSPSQPVLEITRPASWVRTIVHQHEQAQQDLRQLYEACGNQFDQSDYRIRQIERAYETLYQGTLYIYEQARVQGEASHDWLQTELTRTANAYQTFQRQVWEAMVARTTEDDMRRIHQATQVARLNDAVAFLTEANTARNHNLTTFADQVNNWANTQDTRTAQLEKELAEQRNETTRVATELARAQGEIQKVAQRVPVPVSPRQPSFLQGTQRRKRPTALSVTGNSPSPSPPPPPPSVKGGSRGPPNRPPRPPRSNRSASPISPLHSDDGLYDLPQRRSPTIELPSRESPPIQPDERRTFASELAAALAAHLPRQVPAPERAQQPPRVAQIKLPKPGNYDGKPKTLFRSWWKTVLGYFRFYPETLDEQRIAFVGALLTDEAKEWHQARDEEITLRNGRDTWVAYSEVLQAEYLNPREAATAHAKLKALKYKGDIKAYLTAFKALNHQAGSNGEGLQDIINEAIPNEIIDVRFYQNPADLNTDEDFLVATYSAGRHVEKLAALKAAKVAKAAASGSGKEKEKEGQKSGKTSGKARDSQGEKGSERTKSGSVSKAERSGFGGAGKWGSKDEALKGLPSDEKKEYGASKENCWRCGCEGHRTFECYASTTKRGTTLPSAPWKSVSSASKKRGREDDEEKAPVAKQPRTAAVKVEDEDMRDAGTIPIWQDSDSGEDF
jgi:hypothetical protein